MGLRQLDIPDGVDCLLMLSAHNQRLFLQLDSPGIPLLSDDKCPHRGGPLHLCYEGSDGVYRCPWHDNRRPVLRSVKPLCGLSIAGVRSTRAVQVVASAHITWSGRFIRQTTA